MSGHRHEETRMQIAIPDMSCGHCRAAVTEAVTRLDPQARITIDQTTREADIATTAPAAAVLAALDAAGFPASVL
jgi:copper chaperone